MAKGFFDFTKNEMIVYHYLFLKGEGDYELAPKDVAEYGMPKTSFYNGRDGLIKRGILTRIASNYYHFSPIIRTE